MHVTSFESQIWSSHQQGNLHNLISRGRAGCNSCATMNIMDLISFSRMMHRMSSHSIKTNSRSVHFALCVQVLPDQRAGGEQTARVPCTSFPARSFEFQLGVQLQMLRNHFSAACALSFHSKLKLFIILSRKNVSAVRLLAWNYVNTSRHMVLFLDIDEIYSCGLCAAHSRDVCDDRTLCL